MNYSRKNFLRIAGLGLTAGVTSVTDGLAAKTVAGPMAGLVPFKLGMASYSFREYSLADAIAMTKRLGLQHIALKSMHLPLESTPEEIKAVAAQVKEAGLDFYGAGVIYMKTEEEVTRTFDYARHAGLKMIVGVPSHPLLPLVNEMVKKYDLIVAIHNHGPGDEVYPSPASVYEKIKGLDQRIGLCIDIGHTQRIGVDPAGAVAKYADRLYDLHVKDVSAATQEGNTVEIGRGVIDIPGFLRALRKIKYTGYVSLEYEKDGKDAMPGASESIGYVRGVLAAR